MKKIINIIMVLKFLAATILRFRNILDIFPEKVVQNRKSYEFRLWKRKDEKDYMMDYVSEDGQTCFASMGFTVFMASFRMYKVLVKHNINFK